MDAFRRRYEDPEQLAHRRELGLLMIDARDMMMAGHISEAWEVVMGIYAENRGIEQVYFVEHFIVAFVLVLVGLLLLVITVLQDMRSPEGIFREVFAFPIFLKYFFQWILRFNR